MVSSAWLSADLQPEPLMSVRVSVAAAGERLSHTACLHVTAATSVAEPSFKVQSPGLTSAQNVHRVELLSPPRDEQIHVVFTVDC